MLPCELFLEVTPRKCKPRWVPTLFVGHFEALALKGQNKHRRWGGRWPLGRWVGCVVCGAGPFGVRFPPSFVVPLFGVFVPWVRHSAGTSWTFILEMSLR